MWIKSRFGETLINSDEMDSIQLDSSGYNVLAQGKGGAWVLAEYDNRERAHSVITGTYTAIAQDKKVFAIV